MCKWTNTFNFISPFNEQIKYRPMVFKKYSQWMHNDWSCPTHTKSLQYGNALFVASALHNHPVAVQNTGPVRESRKHTSSQKLTSFCTKKGFTHLFLFNCSLYKINKKIVHVAWIFTYDKQLSSLCIYIENSVKLVVMLWRNVWAVVFSGAKRTTFLKTQGNWVDKEPNKHFFV